MRARRRPSDGRDAPALPAASADDLWPQPLPTLRGLTIVLASRFHWRLLTLTIVVLIAAAWLAPRFVRPPDIQENRVLATKPDWPAHLSDLDAFRKAVDAYVADHFPARPHLIGGLNRLRMLAGVSGSKRVIIGRDGWLFFDDDTHLGAARGDPPLVGPQVRQWLLTLAGRTEYVAAHGARYLILTPAAKEVIYPEHGPAWYRGPSPERPAILLPKLAREAGAGEVIYLSPQLAAATKAGQKTFSRHDTHWTGYGAYAGYVGLMTRLHAFGLTAEGPRPLSDFHPLDFPPERGPRDLALMLGVSSFVHLDFPHLGANGGDPAIITTFLGSKTDWTAPQVVETGMVGKPILLMTRDSFSNELMPFLYPHFSRIILSHNQDGFWRQDLIDRFKPDIVLLEVIEAGVRTGVGDGPPPSAEAVDRIDRLLARTAPIRRAPEMAVMPTLGPPDAKLAAIIAAAAVSGNCNVEVATLSPGMGGDATLTTSGWLSELGTRVTSPDGLVALRGAAGTFVGAVKMDKERPDVAAYFKNPTGAKSGFVGTFFVPKLPGGTYTPVVYRRAGGGWIGCSGKTAVTAP